MLVGHTSQIFMKQNLLVFFVSHQLPERQNKHKTSFCFPTQMTICLGGKAKGQNFTLLTATNVSNSEQSPRGSQTRACTCYVPEHREGFTHLKCHLSVCPQLVSATSTVHNPCPPPSQSATHVRLCSMHPVDIVC